MGEIARLSVADNAGLQAECLALVSGARADDPFAPVTLVVDSPTQGWELRRQLVRGLPVGAGMTNLRVRTPTELLSELASATDLPAPGQHDPTLRSAAIAALLRSDTGALAEVRDHPETAVRLTGVIDQLAWCPLEPGSVEALQVSATARAAIDFAARSREALRSGLGEWSWPDVTAVLAAGLEAPPPLEVGHVILCVTCLPTPLRAVLEALADHTPVTQLVVRPAPQPIAARVLSCPDPGTESALAVRIAADALRAGADVDRVAILYSTAAPYGPLLEEALAAAGLAWSGPTGRVLAASAAGRSALGLATMAAARSAGGSGITRPALMRWLGVGHVHDGSEYLSAGTLRGLIREEGLFGDAMGWLPRLRALSTPQPTDDEAVAARRQRTAEAAAELTGLLTTLDDHLGRVTTSGTWGEAGRRLHEALEALHLQGGWWKADPLDLAAATALERVLCESLPTIDGLAGPGSIPSPDPAEVLAVLTRVLEAGRGRHGSMSVGLHVGPVTGARGLVFDHVVLVGAAEGMLPAIRSDDPLLPAAARASLRQRPDDLPTAAEAEAATARDVRAVCGPATVVALFSRGGLPGKAAGIPSRYLPAPPPNEQHERVDSRRAGLALEPPPLSAADLRARAALGASGPPDELAPLAAGLTAWRTPRPGPHYGLVGDVDGEPAWSLHDRTVSASALETYLHCPYQYFVERVLGISTDEYVDEVDTIDARDLGSLVHRTLERFVLECLDEGTVPAHGEGWPPAALTRLRTLLDEEAGVARAEGRTGWEPAWSRTYEQLADSLPLLLELDAAEVRGTPPTRPVAAEQKFGDGGVQVPFPLTDGVVVRLRGAIDRLDASADGTVVGVVDYKTGKADTWPNRLGIPGPRGGVHKREKVQDLVYDVAARVLHPAVRQVRVSFVFVPNGGEPTVVQPDHETDRAATLRALLTGLHEAGERGDFTPTPQGTTDYCPVCARLGRRAWLVAGAVGDDEEVDE